MSMQAWDVPNPNDNGAFNQTIDPGMAFANTPTSSNFDFPMQNAQLQRMQNGNMRNGNGSPAGFQNPMYQTTSVIPSKRPHEFTGSPRQASRSQTPQQGPYPGFPGAINGQTPTPYQHLQQQNSSNTSPSPVMQNQGFNNPGIPPRMQTASPSPFSPAGPNFAPQASPVQSDYGTRVDTPSSGGQAFLHGNPYANGMSANGQSFTPPPGNIAAGFPGGGVQQFNPNAMTMEQQRAFELKRQHMLRQLQADNAAAQQRHPMPNVNPMMGAQNQMGIHPAQMRQQQQQSLNVQNLEGLLRNPEVFANGVAQWMSKRGQPFAKELVIGTRAIPCAHVFAAVQRFGGAKRVTMNNGWQQVAAALQLHPSVANEVALYWQQSLQVYEAAWFANQQQQRQQLQARGQLQAMQGDGSGALAGQVPPGRPVNYNQDPMAALHNRRPSGAPHFQTPSKSLVPGQQDPRQAHLNGFPAAQDMNQQNIPLEQQNLPPQQRPTTAQQHEAAVLAEKRKRAELDNSASASRRSGAQPREDWKIPCTEPISDTFKPKDFKFETRHKQTSPQERHGGIVIESPELTENFLNLAALRPEFPEPFRLGNIDLHSINMSLKSGLPGEARLALNILSDLSHTRDRLYALPPLRDCGDLLESLLDCAEVQIDLLADNAAEVSDVMLISPYEELSRACNADVLSLQPVHEFASLEYQLDKAAERLVCVSTILRNISYGIGEDREHLADESVLKFFATVIRYMGTRNNLLRTNRNTLDFSKDVVLYLSNVAHCIKFSGKEEALCILQFLLSFAPLPQPNVAESNKVAFPIYEPYLHRYLQYAIQALAKLLARGDPNRAYLKSIFAADLASSPSLDLLTRTFGLCIAPLPDYGLNDETPRVKLRAMFLAQGLLAAESLVSLIPQTENNLAYIWLASDDNWSHRLLRIIVKVGIDMPPKPHMNHAMHPRHPANQLVEDEGFDMIVSYGISILRRLAERAKEGEFVEGAKIPLSEVYKKAVLERALSSTAIDPRFLQQLSAYVALED